MATTVRAMSAEGRGYSLTELMVVTALIALLLSMAIPGYQHYVLRARRIDARLMLMAASSMQERYLLQHGHYAVNVQELYTVSNSAHSAEPSAYYSVHVEIPRGCHDSKGAHCYEIIVRTRGAQRRDEGCALWRMDRHGVTRVYDSGGRVAERCL